MPQRKPLKALAVAARAKEKSAGKAGAVDANDREETIVTSINLDKSTWDLLRSVAFHRAKMTRGRASVSKVISDLVDAHRRELEREISK